MTRQCRRVAPRTGARIETAARSMSSQRSRVAPRTGARIETCHGARIGGWRSCRPSHRGADRNLNDYLSKPVDLRSPLAQGRGSKRVAVEKFPVDLASPLAQGRGSKHRASGRMPRTPRVAPRTGARIETPLSARRWRQSRSSPLAQGRGSKRLEHLDGRVTLRVAPRTGARIETMSCAGEGHAPLVAPRTGARIETNALSWRA